MGPLSIFRKVKDKNIHLWLGGFVRYHLEQQLRVPPARLAGTGSGLRHLLFAFCDHYEPLWGNAPVATGEARVRAWSEGYPRLASPFRDADGKTPRHSFFFPGEEYQPSYLEQLAELSRNGFGEVELHLHHDGDTAEKLRADILRYLDLFAGHGHFSRTPEGRIRYGFIHGNWCLANARRDKRWCGVDAEIPLLFDTGCYADYTFPSAPDECQPAIVNRIYWPEGDLHRSRAYEQGTPSRVGEVRRDRILMVQGPIALSRRPGRLALRIESAAVTASDPATEHRIDTWVEQGISVEGRPDWVFVKVHTHGAPERQAASLLGDDGKRMHEVLTRKYNDGRKWALHYVTAREMYNIAIAAMEGKGGNPGHYRDHVLSPPPVVMASGGRTERAKMDDQRAEAMKG